jgi:hypothetical protein
MPSKKGSKVAASRARAQATAKKKARSTGPVLPAAAFATPVADPPEADIPEAEVLEAEGEPVEAQAASAPAPASARAPARPAPRVAARAVTRRERHATVAIVGMTLRREVAMIGAITAVTGVVLTVIKLATDLGA